jgi:ATP-dependent DNA ligase
LPSRCRFPWIVESAPRNRHKQFVVDGEAVLFGVDRISDFMAGIRDGTTRRSSSMPSDLPLSLRKTNLERLLRGRPDGTFVAPFEQREIGPDLFRAACNLGREGMVSKRRDLPYRAGHAPYDGLVELRAA